MVSLLSFNKSADLLIGPSTTKDTTFKLTDGDVTLTDFTMLISDNIFGYASWTGGQDSWMDLGIRYQISSVRFHTYANFSRILEVWGSSTSPNADFTLLGSIFCNFVGWCEIIVTDPTPYRYLRFKNNVGNAGHQINDVEVYGPFESLYISSNPPNAKIWLAPTGQTPADTGRITPDTILNIPEGTYDYRLTLDGYQDSISTVVVRQGPNALSVTMQQQPIQCEIVSLSLTSVEPIVVGGSRELIAQVTPEGSYTVDFYDGLELLGGVPSDLSGMAIFRWETIPMTKIGTHHITAGVSPIPCVNPTEEILIDAIPPAGDVCFQSTPAGASITIDGTLQTGKTTVLSGTECTPDSTVNGITQTSEGHTAIITLEGYEPRIESFFDIFVTIDVGELTPVPGKIVLLSIPPGGRIYYDDNDTGINASAIISDVTPNVPHSIRVVLSGYQDFSPDPITISPGGTYTVYAMMAPIIPPTGVGNLNVTSIPDGVEFGLYTGQTDIAPTLISDIPAGINAYEAGLEEYTGAIGSVIIKAGETTNLNIPLQPFTQDMGLVVIESIPIGADIYIDGSPLGAYTSFMTFMSPNTYSYELRLPGYQNKSGEFTVVTGYDMPAIVSEVLQPLQPTEAGAMILIGGTAIGIMMIPKKLK